MIEIFDLSVTLGKKEILKNVNFHIKEQCLTVILGKNGSGKSTLINCLNQKIPYNGKIVLDNQNLKDMKLRERAKKMSILPQVLPNSHLSVWDLVSMGRAPYLDLTQKMSEDDWQIVKESLKTIGIENLSDRTLDKLSGGERQKAYLAMILAQDTEFLILDEPTTYMDMAYESEFLDLLIKLKNQNKKTCCVVMHNLNQAVHIADRLVILDDGMICFEGTSEEALNQCILEKIFHVQRYTVENRVFFAAK